MTKTVSKKEQAFRLFQENLELLRCPICQQGFLPVEFSSLVCRSNHNFDLARNGYLNLLMTQQKSQYDKELFIARRQVFSAGVYDPLVAKVSSLIANLGLEIPSIIDAGCGEGSFLAKLHQHLPNALLMGIDIAREGIQLAGANQIPIMWCVADLAKLPLINAGLDVVLNVLSPANYSEFRRVLKPKGVVLKVLPGKDYLTEIRKRLGDTTAYCNEGVLVNFEENLEVQNKVHVRYQVPVALDLWSAMVKMTPLTQHRRVQGEPPKALTIDLEIVQGAFDN